MITAQQARDNLNNRYDYSANKLLADTLEEIESSSKGGLNSCRPFSVSYEVIKIFGTLKQLDAFRSSMIETIEQLEQLGYSIHVPKTIIRRKPKYEETVIRW